jgi:HSP20 family protein
MSDVIVNNQQTVSNGQAVRPSAVYTPRFDVFETENEFVLAGDMPGVTADSLEVSVENQELKIWGKVAPRHSEVRSWSEEYGIGDYYRSFTLGDAIDPDAVHAQLKDGVLSLRLGKKAQARPRKITIKGD